MDFARPPGPNALFFSSFLPFFFLAPVLSSFALSASRGEYGPRSTFAHRKPTTTAEGLCLWRVWGKADINEAGTRIEPRETGDGSQPVKNILDLSFCVILTDIRAIL